MGEGGGGGVTCSSCSSGLSFQGGAVSLRWWRPGGDDAEDGKGRGQTPPLPPPPPCPPVSAPAFVLTMAENAQRKRKNSCFFLQTLAGDMPTLASELSSHTQIYS